MRTLAACAALLLAANPGLAQDLLISNGRIVDGNGGTIEQGAILIREGRIVSVSADPPAAPGSDALDARGMTIMPGFFDTHVHTLAYAEGANDSAGLAAYIEGELPSLLQLMIEAGVTTVLDTGGHFPAILDVRDRLSNGQLIGPRLLVSGSVFSHPEGHPALTICRDRPFCQETMVNTEVEPELVRARVAELAEAGVDVIKAVHRAGAHLPIMDDAVVTALAVEAEAQGLPFYVHGTYFEGMVRAVELGADGFVHTPWRDDVDVAVAREVFADAGIPVATTVSLHDSFIDREGAKRTVMGGTFPPAQDGDRALAVANAKAFSDAGVMLAFGTDQQRARPYAQAIAGEARALAEVLSIEHVISVMTRNAAEFLNLGDDLGTLEAGKLADIVIVAGNPLSDISDISNVVMVIQSGRLVVDNR